VRSDRELREDAAEARADHVTAFAEAMREQQEAWAEAIADPSHWVWGEKAHRVEDARLLAEERDLVEGDEETRWRHLMAEGAKRPVVHWRETRLGLDTREFGT
jgi:hypothetical protein